MYIPFSAPWLVIFLLVMLVMLLIGIASIVFGERTFTLEDSGIQLSYSSGNSQQT
jgi:hypothetical protein